MNDKNRFVAPSFPLTLNNSINPSVANVTLNEMLNQSFITNKYLKQFTNKFEDSQQQLFASFQTPQLPPPPPPCDSNSDESKLLWRNYFQMMFFLQQQQQQPLKQMMKEQQLQRHQRLVQQL